MVKYPWILQSDESAIQEEYTVKYKNIVFDFGNVIGKFDGNYILEQFCSSREDMELLIPVLYRNWLDLDAGTVDYEETSDTLRLDMGTIDARMYGVIQSDVFDRSCTACHGGSTEPAAGLYLTEEKSYTALVGVVADQSKDSLLLVNPGNAQESFLHVMLRENVLRYDHTQIITSVNMLQLIDDWINNGANE